MFNTFPFGRWPVAFDALFALMGSNASGGRGFRGEALILFGFGSVWLRDLSMQLCFGFASDVFTKLHIYLIYYYYYLLFTHLGPKPVFRKCKRITVNLSQSRLVLIFNFRPRSFLKNLTYPTRD